MADKMPLWTGLLKWSLTHNDGTTASPSGPMSDEDKEFLRRAVEEGVKDEAKRMAEILGAVAPPVGVERSDEDPAEAEQCDLLEELQDIVEQSELAVHLARLGGLDTLLVLLDAAAVSPRPARVRAHAAAVIATAAQNNPEVQRRALAAGALAPLARAARGCGGDEAEAEPELAARAKALHALSCVARGSADGERALLRSAECHGALDAALAPAPAGAARGGERARLQRRAVFLLHALLCSDADAVEAAAAGAGAPPLPAGKRLFAASDEWREVGEDDVCSAGLEFKLDFASGRNYARRAQPAPSAGGVAAGCADAGPPPGCAARVARLWPLLGRTAAALADADDDVDTREQALRALAAAARAGAPAAGGALAAAHAEPLARAREQLGARARAAGGAADENVQAELALWREWTAAAATTAPPPAPPAAPGAPTPAAPPAAPQEPVLMIAPPTLQGAARAP